VWVRAVWANSALVMYEVVASAENVTAVVHSTRCGKQSLDLVYTIYAPFRTSKNPTWPLYIPPDNTFVSLEKKRKVSVLYGQTVVRDLVKGPTYLWGCS
jgi:hypothetical protein